MLKAAQAFKETFSPLGNRNVALYLGGQSVSLLGTSMQNTAMAWVAWQLSHSTVDLGMVAALTSLPLLFLGVWGGVWADRLDRRLTLIATQATAMIIAFVLAVLVQTNRISLWQIFGLAFALGCVAALDMPTQQAFIGDLSGVAHVRRTVVLVSMIQQIGRMGGPALAGWLMGAIGLAPAFWANGASFLAVIGSLLVVHSLQVRKNTRDHHSGELREGIRYIAGQPRIQDLLILTAFIPFFVFPTSQLMPAVVSGRLHLGPQALGLLLSATGAGSLVSLLVVVPLTQRLRRVGWVLAAAATWSGLWLVVVSFSGSFMLWSAAMFCTALGVPVVMTNANGLLQVLAPPDMRARLLSAWVVIGFGLFPVANLLVGYTAHILGTPAAILVNGSAIVFCTGVLVAVRPGLRRWAVAASVTKGPAVTG
ncbi:enterobactin exporter EntS [Peptococcaceae bacterium CEB3]|nr:enterobactin exporter EntS [Peptococcaceae bacterium CEB3]